MIPKFTFTYLKKPSTQDSVVSIATCYELDGPGSNPGGERDFQQLSRPALGLTQPPVQWVPGHSRG